jgi:hypothetical protein
MLTETQALRHVDGHRPPAHRGRALLWFLVGMGISLGLFTGAALALKAARQNQVCVCFGRSEP